MNDYVIETKKICEMIDVDSHIILPAIQRKFVWKEEQICELFNSIMNGYPIGNILTWKVSGRIINEGTIKFYKFIENYSEKDKKINELIKNVSEDKEFISILDGQQRIQSLLIGLRGTYAVKLPNKSKDKPESYLTKILYLNLQKKEINEENSNKFEFKFLEKNDKLLESQNWFEVGKILSLKKHEDRRAYVKTNYNLVEDELDNALDILNILNACINERALLGCYAIDKNREIDEILDIFVKINSGGTVLSKPDLIFSTIVASWSESRDEFDNFLNDLNETDYNFNIDFLIRTILYLFDIPVTLSIKNFKQLDVKKVEIEWEKIQKAIVKTKNLIKEFGFTKKNITLINYKYITLHKMKLLCKKE